MAGQGTVAVELLSQLPEGVDVCIVPVGGGGLIGGIAAVLKAARPQCIVIGAQPAASDVMRQSVQVRPASKHDDPRLAAWGGWPVQQMALSRHEMLAVSWA